MLPLSSAIANPTGANVVHGSVTINQGGRDTLINQQSQRAVIDWQSFSINRGETTQFNQPSATAAALNRVTSGNPSAIYGTLKANGQIYLINPNGVVVGDSGVINTQSFIASTLNISNESFIAGGDLDFAGNSSATVINLGTIDAAGGDVFLIANKVRNEGTIRADGEVGLGAGGAVRLQAVGDDRISVQLSGVDSQVDNGGLLEAAQVELKAASDNPYALAINQGGVVRAVGAEQRNGRVILSASQGESSVSGSIEAAGGEVQVLGDKVTLKGESSIDVSAATGGGKVLVGGGLQGKGTDKNAAETVMEQGASINADATDNGDGGTVVVWADGHAEVHGTISARGGPNGGDGGLVETSGKESVDFSVSVDASSPQGELGTWLIDPTDITIDRAMADAIEQSLDRDTNVLVTTYTGWPLDEGDTVTDQANSDLIHADADLNNIGYISVDASITKRIGDQSEIIESRVLRTAGQVKVGAETELADAVLDDPVYLKHYEQQTDGSLRLLETTVERRSVAESDVTTDPTLYQIEEIPSDITVVWEITRKRSNMPTLELLTLGGRIDVNAPIVSLNGALGVALNAGGSVDSADSGEGVYINADILTNGGDLMVRAPEQITVADNVTLSTRDVFGSTAGVARFLTTTTTTERNSILANRSEFTTAYPSYTIEEIDPLKLTAGEQDSAYTSGSSGDITMLTDKEIGFSNFYLFYRSDVSAIDIGSNASLLAHSDDARDGSIRLLSVANLTDAFEDIGWLAVWNYAESQINVGTGTKIKGGVVDVIANAQSEADVGSLIDTAVGELVESTQDTNLIATVTVDDKNGTTTAAESISKELTDLANGGKSINDLLNNSGGSQAVNNTTPDTYEGKSTQVKVPYTLLEGLLSSGAASTLGTIPGLGDFLSSSPLAFAVAGTDAQVNIASGVQIEGSNLVTVDASASSSTNATSSAPGLALAVGVNRANSNVQIGDGALIHSSAVDREAKPDGQFTNEPFIKFTATSPWGVGRDFLTQRDSSAATYIHSSATTSNAVSVGAATLTPDATNDLLQASAERKARANNDSTVENATVGVDSPFDIALGITVVDNDATLNVAQNAAVEAVEGTASLLTQSNNSVKNGVVGGKVVRPQVEVIGSTVDGQVSETTDANDVVNIAVAIQYADVTVSSRVDGRVEGKQVSVVADSTVEANSNSATSDNGYDENYDPNADIQAQQKLMASATNSTGLAKWIYELAGISRDNANDISRHIKVDRNDPSYQEFGLAGALALAVNNYKVENIIGSSAELISNAASLEVTANHNSGIIHNSAKAGVHQGRKNATAVSVAIGLYNNDVDVVIEDGARLTANHPGTPITATDPELQSAIRILSTTTIESPFSLSGYDKAVRSKMMSNPIYNPKGALGPLNDPLTYGKQTISNLIENGHLLTTNWANSFFVMGDAPEGTNNTTQPSQEDYSAGTGVAGAFGFVNTHNLADVTIGDATIEVVGGDATSINDIEIAADAWGHTVLAAGNIAPPDLPENTDLEWKLDTATNPVDQLIAGDRAENGVGGAINVANTYNKANVTIYDGADITTPDGALYANAVSHWETALIQLSGGKAKSNGINGTFGLNILDQAATSHIADGAFVNVRDLNVNAVTNLPGNVVLSGGFAFSEANGIGASVAINHINRTASAIAGAVGEGSQLAGGGSIAAERVNVTAVQNGFVTGLAIAGSIQISEGFSGDQTTQQLQPPKDPKAAVESAGGVGISGSVAVNLDYSDTDAVARTGSGVVSKTMNIHAIDNVDITGLSGAASLRITGGVAIAGAASINRAEKSSRALFADSTGFNGYDLNVTSDSIGRIQGISIGAALTTDAMDNPTESPDVTSASIAGSFVYNDIRTDNQALIDNSEITLVGRPSTTDSAIDDDDDALRVSANDGSQIVAVAGALSIAASSNSSAAIGAGVAINTIQGRVDSRIRNSTITEADALDAVKAVAVTANRISPIYSFGVAGAAGNSKMAASASVGINTINTLDGKGTYAAVEGSTINGVDGLMVEAGEESQILSLAGAIAATSGTVAVGGAFSYSEIGGDVYADVDSSNVTVDNNVHVIALTRSANAQQDPAVDLNQAVTDAKTTAGDAFNIYTGGVTQAIKLSEETDPPLIAPVDSIDLFGEEAAIYTLAVAGGGSSNVAVFGSGTVNILTKQVESRLMGSTINAGGALNAFVDNYGSIHSAAGTVAISSGAAAVGGAFTYNTLRGVSRVLASDSTITTGGDLLLGSSRGGLIETLAAGAAVASSVGVQGSAAITTFADLTSTQVTGGSISAGGQFSALSQERVESTTVAGGIAGGGATAVGASLATLVAENKTRTLIEASSTGNAQVDGVNGVGLYADSEELHNTTVMTLSASGTAGVAGSVGIKVANSETHAEIGAGSQINQRSGSGDVVVHSKAKMALTGAAGAVGIGGTAGVGAGLDLTVVNALSTAMVNDGAHINGDNISVIAGNQRDISSLTVAGGGGLVGVAGAVSIVQVGQGEMALEGRQALGEVSYEDADGNTQQAGDVKAYAQGRINSDYSDASITTISTTPVEGDTVAYVGAATLDAIHDITVDATADHDVDTTTGALAVGAVGVGAGVSVVGYKSKTVALTRNALLISHGILNQNRYDDIVVNALDRDRSTHTAVWNEVHDPAVARTDALDLTDGNDFGVHAFAGSAGLAALGAAISVVDRNNSTTAMISGGEVRTPGFVTVTADRDRHTRAFSFGAQVGAAAVGASVAHIHNDGAVLAEAGGVIGNGDSGALKLTITADGDNLNTAIARAAAGGIIAGNGAVAVIDGVALDQQARIGDGAVVDIDFARDQVTGGIVYEWDYRGRVDITATGRNENRAVADGTTVGLGVAVGAMEARNGVSAKSSVGIGNNSKLDVEGYVVLDSQVIGSEPQGSDPNPISINTALARGLSASLLIGVASDVAITEQSYSSEAVIGDSASISSVLLDVSANTDGGGDAVASGGAAAVGVTVGSVAGTVRDTVDANVRIGKAATISAGTVKLTSNALYNSAAATNAVSGSLVGARVMQDARLEQIHSNSIITVADGAFIDSDNNLSLWANNVTKGGLFSTGGSGAIDAQTVVNAVMTDTVFNADINVGAAELRSRNSIILNAENVQVHRTDASSEAYGAGAAAYTTIELDADTYSTVDINSGAGLYADTIQVTAEQSQVNYTIDGLAKIGAAVGSVNASLEHTLDVFETVTVNSGAGLYAHAITLVADEHADTRASDINIEQVNDSITFFLKAGDYIDTQNHTPMITVDGNLYSTTVGGPIIEGIPVAAVGGGSFTFNAGTGSVIGSGSLYNGAHLLKEIYISGYDVVLPALTMFGTPLSAPTVSVTAGIDTVSAKTVQVAPDSTYSDPTINVEVLGDITLSGDIDVGHGTLSLVTHEKPTNGRAGYIDNSAGVTLRANTLVLVSDVASVGSESAPVIATFVDTAQRAPSLNGSALGGLEPGAFYLDATLEAYDANPVDQMIIGDITTREALGLTLHGGSTTGTYLVQGTLSSYGPISINANDGNTTLVIDGVVQRGFDPGVSSVDVVINDLNDVSSNWPGLFTDFRADGSGYYDFYLGDITTPEGGIDILASNLSGSGTIIGNGSALDVNITNNYFGLSSMSTFNIDLRGDATGVSINGDSNVTQYNGITVTRILDDGSNSVTINDPYSQQFIVVGNIKTSGKMTFNVPNVTHVTSTDSPVAGINTTGGYDHDGDGYFSPVIYANELEVSATANAFIGSLNIPLFVDIGEGGVKLASRAGIYITAIDGDLYLNELRAGLDPSDLADVQAIALNGSIIGNQDAYVFGRNVLFEASGDILLDQSRSDSYGTASFSGRNIAWEQAGDMILTGLDATGDVSLSVWGDIDASGAIISVAGTTDIAATGSLTLNSSANDFGGALSLNIAAQSSTLNLHDSNGLLLDTVLINSDTPVTDLSRRFNITTDSGDILLTDSGIFSTTLPLVLDAPGDISLHNAYFNGQPVNFHGANVTLNNADSLDLFVSSALGLNENTATGSLTLSAANGDITGQGLLAVGGDLSLSAAGGSIQFSGVDNSSLTVTGDAAFYAGNAIIANNSSNALGGLVSASAYGSSGISIATSGDLNLGAVTSLGGLAVYSTNGSVSGTEPVILSGITSDSMDLGSSLFVSAPNGGVSLTHPENVLNSVAGNVTTDAVLVSNGLLQVHYLDLTGQLSLKSHYLELLNVSNAYASQYRAGSLRLESTVGDISLDSFDSLVVTGDASIIASNIDITGSDFQGRLDLMGNSVSLTDGTLDGITLGDVQATSLVVNATDGAINSVGAVQVGYTTVLRAAGDIILDNAANDFYDLNILAANNVSLVDNGALRLKVGTSQVTGFDVNNLDVTAGSISIAPDSSAMLAGSSISTPGGVFVGGDMVLTTTSGSIRDGYQGYQVAGNATFNPATDLVLTTSTTDITGVTTITAGRDVVLYNRYSAYLSGGSIYTTADAATYGPITAGRDLSIWAGSLSFDTLTVGGDLYLNTNVMALDTAGLTGAVSSSAIVDVAGTTTIDTLGDVSFTNAANDFGGPVSVFDHTSESYRRINGAGFEVAMAPVSAITLQDVNTLSLGKLNASSALLDATAVALQLTDTVDVGSLNFNATGGAITAAKAIISRGATTLSASGDIDISASGNDFQGSVTASGNNISLSTAGALTLGTVTAASDLTLTATSIDAASTLSVGGLTTLHASGAVNAMDSANSLVGAISADVGSLELTNSTATILSSLTTTGDFALTTTTLDVTGANLVIGRDADFSVGSGALNLIANSFTLGRSLAASATSVTMALDSDLVLRAINATAGDVLVSANSVSIGGNQSATGTLSYTATAGDIIAVADPITGAGNTWNVSATTLNFDAANDVNLRYTVPTGLLQVTSGGDTRIYPNGTATTLGAMNIGGHLSVFASTTPITGSQAIAVGNGVYLSGSDITLNNPSNAITGIVQISASGNAVLVTSGDIVLDSIDATAVDITSVNGSITSSGTPVYQAGMYVDDITLSAGGDIVITNMEFPYYWTAGDSTKVALTSGGSILFDTQTTSDWGGTLTLNGISAVNGVSIYAEGIDTGTLPVTSTSGDVFLVSNEISGNPANGNVTIGTGGVSSGGDIVIVADGSFTNASGVADPLNATGRWLVYSVDPTGNSGDMAMSYNFLRYNSHYSADDPKPAAYGSGNGLVYSVMPVLQGLTITPAALTTTYGDALPTTLDTTSLSGSFDGTVLVDGVAVNAADYGIDVTTLLSGTIGGSDLKLDIDKSKLSFSGGGYANVGDYTGAAVVTLQGDGAAKIAGLGIEGSADLHIVPRDIHLTVTAEDILWEDWDETEVSVTGMQGLLEGDRVVLDTNWAYGQFVEQVTVDDADLVPVYEVGNNIPVKVWGVYFNQYYGDPDNYNIVIDPVTASILPRPLTVTIAEQTKVYDGTDLAVLDASDFSIDGLYWMDRGDLEFTARDGSYNSADVVSASSVNVTNITSGDFTVIDATSTFDWAHYTLASTTATGPASITPAPLTVSVKDASKTYDAQAYSGGNGVNYQGFVNGETASVLGGSLSYGGSAQGAVDSGDYTLSASGYSADNYTISYTDGALHVLPAPLTVTAADVTKVYNGMPYYGGNGVNYSGFVGGEDATVLRGDAEYAGAAQGAVGAGSYSLSVSGLEADNYTITYVDGALTVEQRLLSVSLADQTKVYDGTDLAVLTAADFTVGNFVTGERADVVADGYYNIKHVALADSVTVLLDDTAFTNMAGAFDPANYRLPASVSNTNSGITAAPLTIRAADATHIYDGQGYSGGNGVEFDGIAPGEDLSDLNGRPVYSGSAQNAVNVGEYTLSVSGVSSSNYTISFEDGKLSLLPAPLTVILNDATKTYDAQAYSGGNSVSYSGFVANEDASVVIGQLVYGGSAQDAVNAGSYTIDGSGLSAANYEISYQAGTLTVDKAPLTVTALDHTVTYNGRGYSGGNGVSYSGFVAGEDSSVIDGELTYSGDSQGAVDVGGYSLMPEGLSADNYLFNYVAGNLTIDPRPLNLALLEHHKVYDGSADLALDETGVLALGLVPGEQFTLSATGSYNSDQVATADTLSVTLTDNDFVGVNGFKLSNYSYTGALSNSNSTIVPATVRVTTPGIIKQYDGAAFQGGDGVSMTGFISGEDESVVGGVMSYGGNAQGAVMPGLYSITVEGLTASNYTFEVVEGVLQIVDTRTFERISEVRASIQLQQNRSLSVMPQQLLKQMPVEIKRQSPLLGECGAAAAAWACSTSQYDGGDSDKGGSVNF